MARPLKNRFLSEGMRTWWEVWNDIRSAPIPCHPAILQDLSLALLNRIHVMNKGAAKKLYSLVQIIAAHERHLTKHPDLYKGPAGAKRGERLRHTVEGFLDQIACGKLPRDQHWSQVIRMQRDVLADFIQCNQLPTKDKRNYACRAELLSQWLKANKQKLTDYLTVFPCCCENNKSFRPIAPTFDGKETDLQIIWIVLADLHRTGASNIEKLLKPSARS